MPAPSPVIVLSVSPGIGIKVAVLHSNVNGAVPPVMVVTTAEPSPAPIQEILVGYTVIVKVVAPAASGKRRNIN